MRKPEPSDILKLHRAFFDRITRLNTGYRVWELVGRGRLAIGWKLSPNRHATLDLIGGDMRKVCVHVYERPKPPQLLGRGWSHWVALNDPDFVEKLREILRKEDTAF